MASGHDDDPGFWPGFVAAIAGLVQGLLIVAMALGVSLFVLGQLANGNPSVPVTSRLPAGTSPVKPATGKAEAPALLAKRQDASASQATASVVASTSAPIPQADASKSTPALQVLPAPPLAKASPVPPVVSVEFTGQVVQLPRGALRDLEAAARAARAAGVSRWRVEVETDEQDPARRRTAYLRLMAVRSALLTAGLPATDIEARLRPLPDAAGAPVAPAAEGDTVRVLALPALAVGAAS